MEKQIGRSEGTGNFSGQSLNQTKSATKKIITLSLLAVALISGCATVPPPVPATAVVPPLMPYEREQTNGDIRVVLLKVERATIFTSKNVQNAQPGKSYPVPMIGVTYLVEALGNEPFKHPNTYSCGIDDICIGGCLVLTPENLYSGGDGTFIPGETSAPNLGLSNFIELPKSFDKKRSWVEEGFVRAESSQTGVMQFKIQTGFNDKPETFIFDNVPVN
jgi:hypothetical protein